MLEQAVNDVMTLDFLQSAGDLCLYMKKQGHNIIILVVYVDDGLMARAMVYSKMIF